MTIPPDNIDSNVYGKPDHGANSTLSFALFHCNPSVEPPFTLDLGFSDGSIRQLTHCEHIPAAIERLDEVCQIENLILSPRFTLLYPIYLEAMGTDDEDTMHNIAWLIKEQADKRQWNFGRIGGYDGKTIVDFI